MINLPKIFNQQNYSETLGTGSVTIAQSGCYLCSFAMVANYFGHNITPLDLNNLFLQAKTDYVDGNELTDDDLQNVYSDCVYIQTIPYAGIPADLNNLQSILSVSGQIVILEVNANPEGPNSTLDTHFIVAVSCDGTNVVCADPWTGQLTSGTPYGDWSTTIQKFVIYKGTPVNGGGGMNMYGNPNQYDLNNPDSMKVAIDMLNAVLTGQYIKSTDCDIKVQAQATKDDATVANLNEQIVTLKQQLADAQAQVTTLQAELEAAQTGSQNPDGQDYKTLYIQAEADLKAKSDALNSLQTTYNQAISQYKNSSYLLAPTGTLFQEIVKRIFRLK